MHNYWTAIVLTCPDQDTAIAYQNELKLRQDKGLISKNSLLLSIEDPESPIGSGGATLNALNIVAEALSARINHKMTQIEVIKNNYILIMHMGRKYPFDVIGKAFATLPFQDDDYNLQTNFDILYKILNSQIAGLDKSVPHSEPGVYVCSTDMIFKIPKSEEIVIKKSPVCVVSILADRQTCQQNGIYVLDESDHFVRKIFFKPDDRILDKHTRNGKDFNLISGFVYFNYEVAQVLFSLLLFAPIEGCSYIGIDNGASPLCLSLFFDILLATCPGISKHDYLKGAFKSNHPTAPNQQAILQQARQVLWNTLNTENFRIKNITVKADQFIYMDNETHQHRIQIFQSTAQQNLIVDIQNQKVLFVNSTICPLTDLYPSDSNSSIMNCQLNDCFIKIGANSHLNDLTLTNKRIEIPDNISIQNIIIDFKCLTETHLNLNIFIGVNDHLTRPFDEKSSNWSIMNINWEEFSRSTSICKSDLWPEAGNEEQCLMNAKLYPVLNVHMDRDEMNEMREFFWIDLINSRNGSADLVNKWRKSMRLSIQDVLATRRVDKLLDKRRFIRNKVNAEMLVREVVAGRSIKFVSLIRKAVSDGYADLILSGFDRAAFENCDDLMLLPRILSFISIILSEMAQEFGGMRSGPALNLKWVNSFDLIELERNKEALVKLTKLRQSWMGRNDLLIRASRHYEGAMLAFIRRATSSFKSNSGKTNRIILEPVKNDHQTFEWVMANCPARLDLAGGWSDTPPITYECNGGSSVTNVAILVNGKKPIGAKARVFKKLEINDEKLFIKVVMQDSSDSTEDSTCFKFTELNELRDYNQPRAVACLMKAVFIFTRLVELNGSRTLHDQLSEKLNGALELHTWTGLPQGSGLGTSSILACCVLKVLWYLMGVTVSNETLMYSVLVVEQLMTTNGGWQDQVGAIYGGFKFTRAKNQLPLEIEVNQVAISQEFLKDVNSRLLLIYTGLTRLAKDLLLNVLRNWYTSSTRIYKNVQDLVENSRRCRTALESSDLALLGECVTSYRAQKLVMAPGSEPDTVRELIVKLQPFVHGMALAGAGGGGFLYALTKEKNCKVKMQKLLDEANLNMKIYDAQVSSEGIEFSFC